MEIIDFKKINNKMLADAISVRVRGIIEEGFVIRNRYMIMCSSEQVGYVEFIITKDYADKNILAQGLEYISRESLIAYEKFRNKFTLEGTDSGKARIALFETISIREGYAVKEVLEKGLMEIVRVMKLSGVSLVVLDVENASLEAVRRKAETVGIPGECEGVLVL